MQREGVFREMKRRTVLASFGSDRTPAITGSLGVRCQQPGHDKTRPIARMIALLVPLVLRRQL
jgi:hypothetical protein